MWSPELEAFVYQTADGTKYPLNSLVDAELLGVSTVTTAAPGTSSTQIASTEFVQAALGSLPSITTWQGGYENAEGVYPTTRADLGEIVGGDTWVATAEGDFSDLQGEDSVAVGDFFVALVDNPGQTATNWQIVHTGLGYQPVNKAGDTMGGPLNLVGTSTAATQATNTNNTTIATTAFVNTVASRPSGEIAYGNGLGKPLISSPLFKMGFGQIEIQLTTAMKSASSSNSALKIFGFTGGQIAPLQTWAAQVVPSVVVTAAGYLVVGNLATAQNNFQVYGTPVVAGTSGIRQLLTSASAAGTSTAYLGVNANGDIVRAADPTTPRYKTTVTSASTNVVTHNLSTPDVMVQVFDNATGGILTTTVQSRTTNSVTLSFAALDQGKSVRVLILPV